jgi:uncharacterized protein
MQRYFYNKVAVVTGASSGIGRAVCFELARANARLVLAARREEPLLALAAELSPGEALPCPADVTAAADVARLIEQTMKRFGQIDYLFNCAGILKAGGFGGLSEDSIRQMMEINYMGTVNCIRAAVPLMQQQGSGHIVTLSSLGGKMPFPGSAGYSATKFAIAGLSNALRQELKPDQIFVTAVYPSFVSSPMMHAHLKSVKASRFYRLTGNYSPQQAGKAIVRAVGKRKRELVIPPLTRLMVPLYGLCPGLVETLTGKLNGGWPRYNEPEEC